MNSENSSKKQENGSQLARSHADVISIFGMLAVLELTLLSANLCMKDSLLSCNIL